MSTNHYSKIESDNPRDLYYTPEFAVEAILPYISGKTVWCPCDTDDSAFVKVLSRQNKVINTDITTGQDFMTYEPSEPYDMIVTNPPFSKKAERVKRAAELGKPFAFLLPILWLNDAAPYKIFKDKPFELMLFPVRIRYFDANDKTFGAKRDQPPFGSCYYCSGVLPSPIIFTEARDVKHKP